MISDDLTKFNSALNDYYKLKRKYENQREKIVAHIRSLTSLTTKEKQDKFKQTKVKCVNCGKDGGTIFSQKENILFAKCGDTENPCKLDIQLQKPKYANINDIVADINTKININKLETIRSKLDFLFGYANESSTIAEFNKYKAELINEVKKYQVINDIYLNIINNRSNAQQLSANEDNLFILINSFKDLIKNFEETGKIDFLNDAVDLYRIEIIKTVNTIRDIKYIQNSIEYNEIDNTYHLIQDHYNLPQLLIPNTDIKNQIIVFKK